MTSVLAWQFYSSQSNWGSYQSAIVRSKTDHQKANKHIDWQLPMKTDKTVMDCCFKEGFRRLKQSLISFQNNCSEVRVNQIKIVTKTVLWETSWKIPNKRKGAATSNQWYCTSKNLTSATPNEIESGTGELRNCLSESLSAMKNLN